MWTVAGERAFLACIFGRDGETCDAATHAATANQVINIRGNAFYWSASMLQASIGVEK